MEEIKKHLRQMSKTVCEMVELVYQGLMENDAHYLNSALNKERIIDDLEKEIIRRIAGTSKSSDKKAQEEFVLFGQVAQNTERMGDELRSLIERIEIKIAEKLYFSDIGIEQYKEVFGMMHRSVNMAAEFLDKGNREILSDIITNGDGIKKVVEKYRAEHMERLAKGICQPRAANMFFDMLDFTGNVARHCTNIARIYKEK